MVFVNIAIVGAGQRGSNYARCIRRYRGEGTVVAVADPRPRRRNDIARDFRIPPHNVHADWKQLLEAPKVADAVIIAVLDDLHEELVHAFTAHGYHILCEKPMATNIPDCVKIYKSVSDAQIIFGVGHVLRYSPYSAAVKKVIDSGVLGKIVNIQHIEPVGFHHFVHSYVRGNWGKESKSTFSLMAKCCHDIDILSFFLGGSANPAKKVSSFGSLGHFRPENKPVEAKGATRCLTCPYERDCAYSAMKAYIDPIVNGPKPLKNRAAYFVEDPILDIENVTLALETTQYGECVYNGQNDVVDHQVVNIEYADGATASLTMSAFTESECDRKTVIHGTKGELIGDMVSFTVFDFNTRTRTACTPPTPTGGHGGGDDGLSAAFLKAVAENSQDYLKVTPMEMLDSHLLVFAAEKSRVEGKTIDFEAYTAEIMRGNIPNGNGH